MSPSAQLGFTEFKGWRESKVYVGWRCISGKNGLIWQHLFQTLRKMCKWWVRLHNSQTINCSVQWVFPVILGPISPWKKTVFLFQHQCLNHSQLFFNHLDTINNEKQNQLPWIFDLHGFSFYSLPSSCFPYKCEMSNLPTLGLKPQVR